MFILIVILFSISYSTIVAPGYTSRNEYSVSPNRKLCCDIVISDIATIQIYGSDIIDIHYVTQSVYNMCMNNFHSKKYILTVDIINTNLFTNIEYTIGIYYIESVPSEHWYWIIISILITALLLCTTICFCVGLICGIMWIKYTKREYRLLNEQNLNVESINN